MNTDKPRTCDNCLHKMYDGCYKTTIESFPDCWEDKNDSNDYADIKQQLNRLEEMIIQMTNDENESSYPETMSLGAVIEKLRGIGNQFSSWYGVQTNITSIGLTEDNKVIVKIKE